MFTFFNSPLSSFGEKVLSLHCEINRKNMKKTFSIAVLAVLMSAGISAQVMTTENGKTVVNTTSLGKSIQGFRGPTPLKVTFQNSKIVSVEALNNDETPQYFERVKKEMLSRFVGLTAKKMAKSTVDGVSGATYSSNAVRENVKLAAEYYIKNKSQRSRSDVNTGASVQANR